MNNPCQELNFQLGFEDSKNLDVECTMIIVVLIVYLTKMKSNLNLQCELWRKCVGIQQLMVLKIIYVIHICIN